MPMIPPHGSVPLRWLWLALPEDCAQEAALVAVEYPQLTEAARWELLQYRLKVLRHEVWDRQPRRRPRKPVGLRPSKLKKRSGYRRDSRRKSEARRKAWERIRAGKEVTH
jgi:hypothetical protein